MSKLEELIARLCPDGVEYKSLGEVSYLVTKQTGFDYSKSIKPKLLRIREKDSIPYIQTKNFNNEKRFTLNYHDIVDGLLNLSYSLSLSDFIIILHDVLYSITLTTIRNAIQNIV